MKLRIDKDGSNFVRPYWTLSLENTRFGLSVRNKPCLDRGTVEQLFKGLSCQAVKGLQDLVTKTMALVVQLYSSHEFELAGSRREHGLCKKVPSLEDYNEQRNLILYISVVEETIK